MSTRASMLSGLVLGALATLLIVQYLSGWPVPDADEAPTVASEAPDEDDEEYDRDDDDDDDEAPSRARVQDGQRLIVLEADEAALAGIRMSTVPREYLMPEIRVVGEVVDDTALIDAQRELQAAADGARLQRRSVAVVRQRLDQLRGLRDANRLGAAREIAQLELEHQRALETSARRANAVVAARAVLLSRWGAAVAEDSAPGGTLTGALVSGESALVMFASRGQDVPLKVSISTGGSSTKVVAELLGPAPGVLDATNTPSWYARVDDADLRHGMRVNVWYLADAPAIEGSRVPASAVVWQGGNQWLFVHAGELSFERRILDRPLLVDGGYIVPNLADGAEVVVHGAQALLAEEFRGAIPDEDDD